MPLIQSGNHKRHNFVASWKADFSQIVGYYYEQIPEIQFRLLTKTYLFLNDGAQSTVKEVIIFQNPDTS